MPMSPRLLRPRAAGGFDPRAISGLALWLDAADSATLGPTSSGPGAVSNNGPVKYWGDKSGNDRHATTAGADSISPSFLQAQQNGLSALGFDGGDSLTGQWNVSLTSQTVFAVVRPALSPTLNQGSRIWTQSDAGGDFQTSGHYIPLLINLSANIASYASSGFQAGVSTTAGQWQIACSRHTGSQIQNRINNGTAVTFNHTLNKTFTRYAVSTDFSGAFWRDRMSEILVFSRSVSNEEMTALFSYLGNKWGITVS